MCFCIFFIIYRSWSELQCKFGQVRIVEFIYRVLTLQKGDIIMSDLFYHYFFLVIVIKPLILAISKIYIMHIFHFYVSKFLLYNR